MRICLFIDSKDMGGIESHVLQVISGLLADTRYSIDILFWQDYKKDSGKTHPMLSILAKMDDSQQKRCRYLSANGSLLVLFRYFKKIRPLVHSHGYKAGILSRVIGLLTKTSVVSTYHNGDPGSGRLKIYNALDRVTSFLSTNIAVNDLISEPLKNCTVISNFVNTLDNEVFKEQSESRKSVAFVGRLSHEKGPDIFAKITEEINMPIAIYGDGPMTNELKDQYLHIDFKGMCDMENHWQDIRLLVMPSRYEGLPLAALEAMARGIPVIASTAGALPSLINNCGIGKSINIDNIIHYQEAISDVIAQDDYEYRAQGEKLIEYIDKNYSREKIIPLILQQYKIANQ